MIVVALALLAVLGATAINPPRYQRTVFYHGQQVLSCPLRHGLDALDNKLGLDIWGVRDGRVSIRVKNAMEKKEVWSHFNGNCSVEIDDLEALAISEERSVNASTGAADWHQEYHTYSEIVTWYSDLASASDLVTFSASIGSPTPEGRNQPAVVITSTSGGSGKPRIYWQCQIHAREWISGATCMFVVDYFVTNYGSDDVVTKILDDMEIHVVPFVNPDGYAYTWSDSRLWRKNRLPNSGSSCVGTDLNRNYNDHWGQGGSSSNPCSDTYMGSSAGSCIETQNTVAYFKSIGPIYGAIDWHSYSQLILRPYGWTSANSPDEVQLRELGNGMRDVALSVHAMRYTSQKSIQLYTTTGTASDWFYGDDATSTNGGYKAAGYTIELRDTGRYGFQLPADQIIPQGEEMVATAKYFCLELLSNPIRA